MVAVAVTPLIGPCRLSNPFAAAPFGWSALRGFPQAAVQLYCMIEPEVDVFACHVYIIVMMNWISPGYVRCAYSAAKRYSAAPNRPTVQADT
jgi:hypothetical protein